MCNPKNSLSGYRGTPLHVDLCLYVCNPKYKKCPIKSPEIATKVGQIWKYHIAFHCWAAWSCVLHTFAAFPPSPSLGPRSFATRFRKGLVPQKIRQNFVSKCLKISNVARSWQFLAILKAFEIGELWFGWASRLALRFRACF